MDRIYTFERNKYYYSEVDNQLIVWHVSDVRDTTKGRIIIRQRVKEGKRYGRGGVRYVHTTYIDGIGSVEFVKHDLDGEQLILACNETVIY